MVIIMKQEVVYINIIKRFFFSDIILYLPITLFPDEIGCFILRFITFRRVGEVFHSSFLCFCLHDISNLDFKIVNNVLLLRFATQINLYYLLCNYTRRVCCHAQSMMLFVSKARQRKQTVWESSEIIKLISRHVELLPSEVEKQLKVTWQMNIR